ncbi:MAG: D-alanine--D-alanine ligase family protein [Vicinamibacterales bacterium]
MTKLRVGVLYGGRSGEHEVSVASAASILKYLDPDQYEAVPILIGKDGAWSLPSAAPATLSAAAVIERARAGAAGAPEQPAPSEARAPLAARTDVALSPTVGPGMTRGLALDVVFPVLHGPFGEDGTVQGLLELADLAYVGAGVLASAAGMDKVVMKRLFEARGLPVTPWRAFTAADWARRRDEVTADVLELGMPVFVKPANLGSSVGISKVKAADTLAAAVEEALSFDRKVIVEAGVPDPREIECAVLGNDDPIASVPGEIVPSREFYDYESK